MEEEQKPDFWFVLRDMKRPNAHNSGYLSLLEMPELQGDLFIPLKQMLYNHFGKRKLSRDPTPLEIEMRLYENDIHTTLIDGVKRQNEHIDVK